ncbi:MAG: hypothetical protein JW863_14770 [Chitinispirillaceae bacterium]|nr:hypothetical protein [Chitinispirillaceae bacterium]
METIKTIIAAILVSISSCGSKSNGGDFVKDNVSFSYASGWSITEQEDYGESGYYLSVEKKGFDESGLMTVTWINAIRDSMDYLEIIQQEYRKQKLLKNLEFAPIRKSTFNGMPSLSCDFKFKTIGVGHNGTIYVFLKGGKTYSIIRQEALEDVSKNKEGFELLESSFKVE